MSRKKQKILDSFEKRDVNQESTLNTCTSENTSVGKVITSSLFPSPFWHKLHEIEQQMNKDLSNVSFPKDIACIYNPLIYARALHCEFMSKFLDAPKKVIFVGMNPGPFGMCQTGVPFGHVPTVKDWLKLTSEIEKPEKELPARPVEGLNCTKVEQSGLRWWGLIRDICGTPDQFFKHCFIYNYCPLAFFAAGGRNITPAEIKGESKAKLQEICNNHLCSALNVLQPEIIISIGKYAEDRVKDIQKRGLINPSIAHKCIPHPSPRSLNNQDWPKKARIWFEDNGLMPYLQN